MAAEAKRIRLKQEQRYKEHQQKWAEARLTAIPAIPQTHLRLGLRGGDKEELRGLILVSPMTY
jgi:hypothetical protein